MADGSPEDFQKKWLTALVLLASVGACVVVPLYAFLHAFKILLLSGRFVLDRLGSPLGVKCFQPTRHSIWKTNFIAMPPNDLELAAWLASQPHVVASSVTREPYWVTFDCIRRGFGLQDIQMASTAKARELGYDTGKGISVIEILG